RLGRCGLSSKELSRVEVMGRVKAGSLRLQEAAELLGLSYRQAKRVWARYRGGGAKALQHGNCGRVSNRAHPEEFRQAVLVQIGAMWIEQQRAESCRGHGAGKGGQLAAARGGGVAGAELSASQAGVGALSRWGCESAAAWQLRASLQPSSPRGVSPSGARSGRQALCGLRADAGGGTLGGRRRTASGRRDPAALDESGRTLAPPASAKAVSPAQDAQAAFRRTGQLDASFHPWLEDRAANGCLMHMVDDATGTVLCQFSAGETTWAAAHLLRAWIERYGVPRALYTDWKNVYVRLPNVQERLRGEAA